MNRHNRFVLSDLMCLKCGNIIAIPRTLGREREKYHIKDFNCPNCMKITKHVELKQADVVRSKLKFKNEQGIKLKEVETIILNLFESRETNEKEKTKCKKSIV